MSSEQVGGTPGSGAMSDRMRALLSRAAEEQLLEQRQVSTVLGELRALVEDVDERLATGEQVERVTAEVRGLLARVEERLDAAEARSAELADRISEATAMVGRAAQDLVEAVAAGVAERVEAQLLDVTASLTATTEAGERRMATHVDDAVLALAEVVLRRRSGQAAPVPAAVEEQAHEAVPASVDGERPPTKSEDEDRERDLPTGPPAEGLGLGDGPAATGTAAGDGAGPDGPAAAEVVADEPTSPGPAAEDGDAAGAPETDSPDAAAAPDAPAAAPDAAAPEDAAPDDAAARDREATPPLLVDPATDGLLPAVDATASDDTAAGRTAPGDGFVLVPADVEEPDAGPAPPVQQERRTAERRTAERADGSGRRRRPWWRPV